VLIYRLLCFKQDRKETFRLDLIVLRQYQLDIMCLLSLIHIYPKTLKSSNFSAQLKEYNTVEKFKLILEILTVDTPILCSFLFLLSESIVQ